MTAPRTGHRGGSSLKRKRPNAQDFIDDQPPNRPLADISNMYPPPHDRSDSHYASSPPDRRDSSPPRQPRAYRDRDGDAEFSFTSEPTKLRGKERDRGSPHRGRSKSPDRRHYLGRYEEREYDRRPTASIYRPIYYEPTRTGIQNDRRGILNSTLSYVSFSFGFTV